MKLIYEKQTTSNTYNIAEPIFKVQDVSVVIDKNEIIHSINLDIFNVTRPNIEQGQVISLIGRSGIGKSVLFSVLAGLSKPTTGTVLIDTDLHPVIAGEVGVVTQSYTLFHHLTVLENLKVALNNNPTLKNNKDIINYYTHNFDLEKHINKYPKQLSGGQRQRAAIVQQILSGNKFILFDEPFSGLDVIMIDKVIELLNKISVSNELNTLVIVSHDLENCLSISDTAFILAKPDINRGATIIKKYDLMSMGLSWDANVKDRPEFRNLIKEIKNIL